MAPAHGHDVRPPAPRAAAHPLVADRRRAGAAPDPRDDAARPRPSVTRKSSTRSVSTCTATATTPWRGTATATGTRRSIPSSRSSASAPADRSACALARRRARPPTVVRPRWRRPAGDGRRVPARLGAHRPQGPCRRSAHLDHVPPRRVAAPRFGGFPAVGVFRAGTPCSKHSDALETLRSGTGIERGVVPGDRGEPHRYVEPMELVVEVVHDGRASTDVVFEVEPARHVRRLADAVGFLQHPRTAATFTIARTGETPRRDDRVADVDVRSGDRLTLVDSINAVFSVTPDAFGATLVVTSPSRRRDRVPAALRRQPGRAGRRQRRRRSRTSRPPAATPASPSPTWSRSPTSDRRTASSSAGRRSPRRRCCAPARTPRSATSELAIRDHLRAVGGGGLAQPDRVQPAAAGRPAPTAASRSSCPPRPTSRAPAAADDLRRASRSLIGVGMYFCSGPIGAAVHAAVAGAADRQRDRGPAQRALRVPGAAAPSSGRSSPSRSSRLEAERAPTRCAAGSARQPGAGELRGIVDSLSDRLWERAPDDADFLRLRVGTAELPSRTPGRRRGRRRRGTCGEVEGIPGRFQLLDDVPLAVDLLDGTRRRAGRAAHVHARPLARSLVLQAATMHSPTDLAVVALVGEAGLADWRSSSGCPTPAALGGSQLASTSHHALGARQRRCSPPRGRHA